MKTIINEDKQKKKHDKICKVQKKAVPLHTQFRNGTETACLNLANSLRGVAQSG